MVLPRPGAGSSVQVFDVAVGYTSNSFGNLGMTDSFCCLKTPHWGSAKLQTVPQPSPLLFPLGMANLHVTKLPYMAAQQEHS